MAVAPTAAATTPPAPVRPAEPDAAVPRKVAPWQWVAAVAALALVVVIAVLALSGDDEPPSEASLGPAQLGEPAGVAVDAANNLYVADLENNVVKKVAPDGTVTTAAGTGQYGVEGDGGPATSAAVGQPATLAVDRAGNLYIGQGYEEGSTGGIRRVAPDGTITSVPVRSPGVDRLVVRAMAVAPDGGLLVATAREVLRVAPDGTLVPVAGSASAGFGGDGGPATSAKLDKITSLAVAPDGSIYVADSGNNRIRRVANGTISTVAGTGSPNQSGDGGPAVEAGVGLPFAVATRDDGSLFIATDNQVRLVTPDGTIRVFAGDPDDASGFAGDGGVASSARLNEVVALAFGGDGSLYVSDYGNDRVRRIGPDGIITTVA